MKKLEDELGTRLLVRHGRGVELTEAGAQLLGEAKGLIEHFSRTLEKMRAAMRRLRARWCWGAAHRRLAPCSHDLPPLSRTLAGGHVAAARRYQQFAGEWLLDGRLDVALLHNPTPVEGVNLRAILSEQMVLVTSPASPAHQARMARPSRSAACVTYRSSCRACRTAIAG